MSKPLKTPTDLERWAEAGRLMEARMPEAFESMLRMAETAIVEVASPAFAAIKAEDETTVH